MNPTIDLIKSHRSIRKFTEESISPDTLQQLIEAGQAAATSSFVQSVSVIRVSEPTTRSALAEVAGGQRYVETCAEFLVICADMKRNEQLAIKHGTTPKTGFTEHFVISAVDAGLFAQNLVTAAESAGLGVCYIGALRNDPQTVSDLLRLPELVCPLFGLCLGYPAQDPEVKPRMPISMVMHQEHYQSNIDENTLQNYDNTVVHYYATRTGGTKSQGWSEQMATFFSKESRPHMLKFLRGKGFVKN